MTSLKAVNPDAVCLLSIFKIKVNNDFWEKVVRVIISSFCIGMLLCHSERAEMKTAE